MRRGGGGRGDAGTRGGGTGGRGEWEKGRRGDAGTRGGEKGRRGEWEKGRGEKNGRRLKRPRVSVSLLSASPLPLTQNVKVFTAERRPFAITRTRFVPE